MDRNLTEHEYTQLKAFMDLTMKGNYRIIIIIQHD